MSPTAVRDLPQLTGLAWIDQFGLALAGVFLLLGVWRGLWWQVVRLLGVVAAVALARGLSPRFAPGVQETLELDATVAHGLAWMALFLAGLVVASLFGMIGKRTLEAMQLGLVDRAGGAVAGLLTGIVLHLAVLVVLIALAPGGWATRQIEGTRSAFLLDAFSQKAHVLVDAQAAERFPPLLGVRGGSTPPPAPSSASRVLPEPLPPAPIDRSFGVR